MTRLWADKLSVLSLLFLSATILLGIGAPAFAPHDPAEVHMELRYASSSWEYWLGNDHLGRCVLSRLIFGIRPSVLAVMAALAVSVGIGAAIGLIAGYWRGRTDALLMRLCDVMLSFPGYVMALAVIGILGTGLDHLLFAFVIVKWAWFARMIRSAVMQYSDSEYVQYAQVIGASSWAIMAKHILPVALPNIAVLASSSLSSTILQLSGFSFLGLGVQPPAAEWGMMLNEARTVMFSKPELMLAPGMAVILTVSAFNYLADALQIALDPKLSASRGMRHRSDSAAGAAAKLTGREAA